MVFSPSNTLTGEVSTMTIAFSNSNASSIDGVTFTDALPDGIVNTWITIDNNSCGGVVARPDDHTVMLSGASIPQGSCSIDIPVVGVVAGSFDNDTGEIDSSNAPPGLGASGTLTVGDGSVVAAPTVTKSFAPSSVPSGGVSQMTITLTNSDAVRAITGAEFFDSYPAGMINVDNANPTALYSNTCGGTATADANGVSASLVDGVVPPSGSCSVVVNIVGTSTATNSTGPVASNNAYVGMASSAVLTVAGGVADLTLTKSHNGDFSEGQTGATYTLIATNSGDAPTGGPINVVDTLPGTLTATGISGPGWTCNLQSTSCARSDQLAPGASYPAITLTVDVASMAPPVITNTATVSGGGETDTGNDTAVDPTTIDSASQNADLSLTKSHNGNFSQGQMGATYFIVAHNIGAAASNGTVVVSDALPDALTATDMSGPGWTCDLQTTSCARSDQLIPGASYPAITLTVDVASMAPPVVTNTATVSGGGETDIGNDTAVDPTAIDGASQTADLTLTKSHNGNFSQGQVGATYLLVAHNIGAAASSGTVVVSDALPGSLTATGMSGPGWTCDLQTTSCTSGDPVGPGGSYPAITLVVDVATDAPPSVLNTAMVSGGGETNTANDTASDLASVTQQGVTVQAITFTSTAPNNAQVAGPTYHAAATATSGLSVALSIDASSATVCAIANDIVSFIGAGTCTIDANQAGDGTYAIAPQAQQSFAVASAGGAAPQTITFTSSAPGNAVVAGPSYSATATASSQLAVVLTIEGSSATVCTIDNGIVAFIGAGICTIDANQGGNGSFAAAPEVQQSFEVASAGGVLPQNITFESAAPNGAKVAGPAYHVVAKATSNLPVVLTINGSSATVCTIGNDMVNFIGAGVCTIDANQGGDSDYAAAPEAQQSFTVASAGGVMPQTIAFTSTVPANASVVGATYLATATATSRLAVVLTIDGVSATVCSINDGTVTFIGVGTCMIDANQGGDASYAAASQVQQSFPVAPAGGAASQTIAFTSAAPNNATVAGPVYQATATASSGLPVVLTIDALSNIVCSINNGTVTFIGAGICTIDANQGGDATYAPAPEKQQSFPVASAGGVTAQTITFTSTPPIDATVDGPTYLATATASSRLPVVLTIDALSAAVCTINDGTVTFIGAGTCIIDANQGGDAIYAPAPEAQQAFAVIVVDDIIFRNGFEGP
jgi:hypothetical protein